MRIVLHAPTPAALERARRNAANLLQAAPAPQVRIVLNGDAVSAALDADDTLADPLTFLCPTTLARLGRAAREPLAVLDEAAVLALARMQEEGWAYIRA